MPLLRSFTDYMIAFRVVKAILVLYSHDYGQVKLMPAGMSSKEVNMIAHNTEDPGYIL